MTASPVRLISVSAHARVDARVDQAVELGEAASNAICLAGGGIAPQHARITPIDGRWMVEPLSVSRPTRLNDDLISGSTPLVHLDVLSIGDVDLVFVDRPGPVRAAAAVDAERPPRPAATPVAVPAPVAAVPAPAAAVVDDRTSISPMAQAPAPPPRTPVAGGAPLTEASGDQTSFSPQVRAPVPPTAGGAVRLSGTAGAWTLLPGRHTVGRSPDCEVCVNLRQVSREHAVLVVDGSGVTIENLGGQNGTTVNGKDVMGAVRVTSGDQLAFAGVEFTLVVE